jgi:hypothetical protein
MKKKNSYDFTEGYLWQLVAGLTLVTVVGLLVLVIGRRILKIRFNTAIVVQFYSGLL